MAEHEIIDHERFQKKRQEAETGRPLFPDEIRDEPIDFSLAKDALINKKQKPQSETATEIKITPGNESGFVELNDERFKLMNEMEAGLRKAEEALHTKSHEALETVRKNNPELADFLELQASLGLIKEFSGQMKTLIHRASSQDELNRIATKSREFLASIPKVS